MRFAFIFADLIVIPILDIYRKYYGLKMGAFLLGTFYASIALAIEFLFQAAGLDRIEPVYGIRYPRLAYTERRLLPFGGMTFTSILRNAPEGPGGVGLYPRR